MADSLQAGIDGIVLGDVFNRTAACGGDDQDVGARWRARRGVGRTRRPRSWLATVALRDEHDLARSVKFMRPRRQCDLTGDDRRRSDEINSRMETCVEIRSSAPTAAYTHQRVRRPSESGTDIGPMPSVFSTLFKRSSTGRSTLASYSPATRAYSLPLDIRCRRWQAEEVRCPVFAGPVQEGRSAQGRSAAESLAI